MQFSDPNRAAEELTVSERVRELLSLLFFTLISSLFLAEGIFDVLNFMFCWRGSSLLTTVLLSINPLSEEFWALPDNKYFPVTFDRLTATPLHVAIRTGNNEH